jgi:hypothetical protein
VDGQVSRWQAAEAELFLHRTLGQDRRLIPVLTRNTAPNALPGYVGNLRYLRFGSTLGPAEVARGLVRQLNGSTVPVESDGIDPVEVLRQASGARLSPARWGLVDEIVGELLAAASAGDDLRVREIAADIALVIRSRDGEANQRVRVSAPTDIRTAIEWLFTVLRKDLE